MPGARRSRATPSSTDPKRAAAPKKKKATRARKVTTVVRKASSWLEFQDILLGRVLDGPGGVKGTVGPTFLVGTDFESVETYQVQWAGDADVHGLPSTMSAKDIRPYLTNRFDDQVPWACGRILRLQANNWESDPENEGTEQDNWTTKLWTVWEATGRVQDDANDEAIQGEELGDEGQGSSGDEGEDAAGAKRKRAKAKAKAGAAPANGRKKETAKRRSPKGASGSSAAPEAGAPAERAKGVLDKQIAPTSNEAPNEEEGGGAPGAAPAAGAQGSSKGVLAGAKARAGEEAAAAAAGGSKRALEGAGDAAQKRKRARAAAPPPADAPAAADAAAAADTPAVAEAAATPAASPLRKKQRQAPKRATPRKVKAVPEAEMFALREAWDGLLPEDEGEAGEAADECRTTENGCQIPEWACFTEGDITLKQRLEEGEQEGDYGVERVLDERAVVKKGKVTDMQYLVKWEGYELRVEGDWVAFKDARECAAFVRYQLHPPSWLPAPPIRPTEGVGFRAWIRWAKQAGIDERAERHKAAAAAGAGAEEDAAAAGRAVAAGAALQAGAGEEAEAEAEDGGAASGAGADAAPVVQLPARPALPPPSLPVRSSRRNARRAAPPAAAKPKGPSGTPVPSPPTTPSPIDPASPAAHPATDALPHSPIHPASPIHPTDALPADAPELDAAAPESSGLGVVAVPPAPPGSPLPDLGPLDMQTSIDEMEEGDEASSQPASDRGSTPDST